MPEIDTSSYPKPQGQTNWLQLPLQAQQMQSNQLGLYQQQQEIQARQALGPIMQQSVDPATGQLDYNKAFQMMSADPRTAWKAPDFLNQAIQRQSIQVDMAKKELEMNKERFGMFAKVGQGLLAAGTAGDRGKVVKALADMHQMNPDLFPKSMYLSAITQLPNTPNLAPGQQDPALMSHIKGVVAQAGSASETLDRTGKIIWKDTGGQEVPVVENQIAGTTIPVPGGALQKGLTPEQKITPHVVGTDEMGNEQSAFGGDIEKSLQGQPGNQSPAGVAASPNAGTPGQSNPPNSAPAPIKTFTSKQGAPVTEEQKEFVNLGTELSKDVQASNNVMQLVAAMRDELEHFTTGPGQETRAKLAQLAMAAGASKEQVDKVFGGSLADAQAFTSNGLQLATALMKKALEGGGRFTNLEFSSYTNTKPNLETIKEAAQKIFNQLEVAQKASVAQNSIYTKYRQAGQTPSRSAFVSFYQPYQQKIQDELQKGGLNKVGLRVTPPAVPTQ